MDMGDPFRCLADHPQRIDAAKRRMTRVQRQPDALASRVKEAIELLRRLDNCAEMVMVGETQSRAFDEIGDLRDPLPKLLPFAFLKHG
jgi:hypothetical protein